MRLGRPSCSLASHCASSWLERKVPERSLGCTSRTKTSAMRFQGLAVKNLPYKFSMPANRWPSNFSRVVLCVWRLCGSCAASTLEVRQHQDSVCYKIFNSQRIAPTYPICVFDVGGSHFGKAEVPFGPTAHDLVVQMETGMVYPGGMQTLEDIGRCGTFCRCDKTLVERGLQKVAGAKEQRPGVLSLPVVTQPDHVIL